MRTTALATGTSDVQATTGSAILYGFSVRETGAAAIGQVVLRNGTSASDPAVAFIQVPISGWVVQQLPAIDCPAGIFVDRGTGTTEVIVYVG